MFNPRLMLTLLLVALSVAPAVAQTDLPPQLGFSSYDDYASGYQIYDFATGQAETVERDGAPPEPSFYVGPPPPAEIIINRLMIRLSSLYSSAPKKSSPMSISITASTNLPMMEHGG